MSWDEPSTLPDHKNPKVFRHAKMDPEEAKHKRRWDSKKCKRNKGGNHEMVLVHEEKVNRRAHRTREEDGERIFEERPSFFMERKWACKHCGKHGDWTYWGRKEEIDANAYGAWKEYHRVPLTVDHSRVYRKGYRPEAPYRKSHGYRRPRRGDVPTPSEEV
ncbi:hypothetical protein PP304_gp200 [Gordonia phage Phendrix]|uniref:Uncharacterized protein n=1 Tax=Gordonia phage Phendrix TaxID=2593335 RepID=A0A514U148_9CAUD|nr:hypothetical protein PP304_gp200 [Gordonia phage Phendrix]QDK02670.1 hypothetical protein SEA_PHENDRIX_135 [Gordonia phage Phendrix]